MLVVADSSALIALATCQALGLLTELFEDIKVPQAVFDEVAGYDKPQAIHLSSFLAGRVLKVDLTRFIFGMSGLGQGEIEAMALYKELSADFLLIDDHRARFIAETNEIHCIGALGILLLAKHNLIIDQVSPYIRALMDSSLYYSKDLIAKVLQLAGE